MQKVQGVPSFPTKRVLAAKTEPTPTQKPNESPKSENEKQSFFVSSMMQDIVEFFTHR